MLCVLREYRAATDQVSGATTTAAQAQGELSLLAGSESGDGEEGGSSGQGSEAKSDERTRKRRGGSSFGPRKLGDVEEQGFTGTRMGYQVQKVGGGGGRRSPSVGCSRLK